MLFAELENINARPGVFECYTARDLWTDEHTSKHMLSFHLNEHVNISSRTSAFIEASVAWIVTHFGLSPASAVADFGCGPGLYASRLAEHGARVTGVDFSLRSIQYARSVSQANGLSVTYVHCNYLEFETEEKYDLILMIMCDYCALSPSQRKKMLATFSSLLKPGGRILLDVYSLVGFEQRQEAAGYEANQLDGFWSPYKYYGFQNTFRYEDAKVVLDKFTIVEPTRTRTIYNWLQYFDMDSLTSELAESGLKVIEVFADVAGKPFDPRSSEFAIVAALL